MATPEMHVAAAQTIGGLVYEQHPSHRWCAVEDIPPGYCGIAYHADDPRCREAIAEDIAAGWSLSLPAER